MHREVMSPRDSIPFILKLAIVALACVATSSTLAMVGMRRELDEAHAELRDVRERAAPVTLPVSTERVLNITSSGSINDPRWASTSILTNITSSGTLDFPADITTGTRERAIYPERPTSWR